MCHENKNNGAKKRITLPEMLISRSEGWVLVPLHNWSLGVASKLIETHRQPHIRSIKQFKTAQLSMDCDPLDCILRVDCGKVGGLKWKWQPSSQLAPESWSNWNGLKRKSAKGKLATMAASKAKLAKAARRWNESDNRKTIPLSLNHCDLDSQCTPIEISGTLVFKDTTRIIITNWVTDFVLTIISGYQPQPITPNLEEMWSSSSSSSSSSNYKM